MNCEMCKELEAEVARLKAQAQLWTTRAELARLRELEAAVLENRTLENAIGISPRTVAAIAACRATRESAKPVCSGPESALCPVHDVLMGPVHVEPESAKPEPCSECGGAGIVFPIPTPCPLCKSDPGAGGRP
jgi:hypothetical protein